MPRPKQPQPEPTPQTDPGDSTTPDDEQVELIEIDFRGLTFTVPKYADDWDTETLFMLSRRGERCDHCNRVRIDALDLVTAVIGPEHYERFRQKYPKGREFQDFRDLLFTTVNREVVGL